MFINNNNERKRVKYAIRDWDKFINQDCEALPEVHQQVLAKHFPTQVKKAYEGNVEGNG